MILIKEDPNGDEEEWEEVKSDDEPDATNDIEMNQENDVRPIQKDPIQLHEFRQLIKQLKLSSLIINSFVKDDENIFQENERIEHLYNGIDLLRFESLQAYLMIIQSMDKKETVVEVVHLLALLRFCAQKENLKQNLLVKVSQVSHEIFAISFLNSVKVNQEIKVTLINFIKDILLKYKTSVIELCARMGRILVLLAVKERNVNLNEGQLIIQVSLGVVLNSSRAE